MTEYSDLPPRERIAKYRELAARALKASSAAHSQGARDHYLFIAAQWAGLATDIELRLREEKNKNGR